MLESNCKSKYRFEMVLLLEKNSIVLYITSYDPLFSVDAKQTIGTPPPLPRLLIVLITYRLKRHHSAFPTISLSSP